MKDHRGSRRHILDWVETPDFSDSLSRLLEPTTAAVRTHDYWMPRQRAEHREPRLEVDGARFLPDVRWDELRSWWLSSPKKANTPNWDLASSCDIGGRRGLVLVEAKANCNELSRGAKTAVNSRSQDSVANDRQIRAAVSQANEALCRVLPGIALRTETHYQLANRIATSWWLASHGVPVVLVYLGFLGDMGIADVSAPFIDEFDWQRVFTEYAADTFPIDCCNRKIDCGADSFWVLVRSRKVLTQSPRRVL